MRRADRIAGAALLGLAVAFSVGALQRHAYWGEHGPGPAFLPFWLGVVMALLAAMLLLGALRSGDPGPAWLPQGKGLRRLLIVLGMTTALVALLNIVGMVLGTVLFLVGLFRLLDRFAWPLTLGVALAVAGCNFLVFSFWLKVPLPVGLLGF